MTLKIDQVFSKDTIPNDLADAGETMDTNDPLLSEDDSNQAQTNGYFAAISTANGIKTATDQSMAAANAKAKGEASKSPTSASAPNVYIPTKIVEIRPAKSNVWREKSSSAKFVQQYKLDVTENIIGCVRRTGCINDKWFANHSR